MASSKINILIEQRTEIANRILNLVKSIDGTSHNPQVETRIKLLQRKQESINAEIEVMCSHDWGAPDWGYTTCENCGKMRSTRN